MRVRARAALLSLLGCALLVALLLTVPLESVVASAAGASLPHLLFAFTAYAGFFLLRGLRWKLLLDPHAPAVRVRSTTSVTAVGWLVNSILPLKAGDVLRAALLARRERVAFAASAASVGLERVLDLLGLATLAAVALGALPAAADLPPGVERALGVAAALPLAALLLLGLLVRYRDATVRAASRLFRPLGGTGRRLVDFGASVLDGVREMARRPALLARLAPLTAAIVVLQALVFAFLALAFLHGPSFPLAFAGSAVFLLTFVVSLTPGNVGTYEAAFAAVFVGLGTDPAVAIPAAVLTHVATTLTVVIFGGAALLALSAERPAPPRATPDPTRGGAPP